MGTEDRPRLIVQLDWPSIADWAYAGIFAVAVRFQNQDQFWIPQPKLHGACILGFFKKSQNEVVWSFLVFLAILAKIDDSPILATR